MAVLEIHARDVDRAGRQLHKVVDVAPVQRQVVELGGTNRGGQLGIFRVNCGGFAADFDHFLCLAQRHFHVHPLNATGVQRHIAVGQRFEPRGFSRDLVCARWQFFGYKQAGLVGRRGNRKVGRHVGH